MTRTKSDERVKCFKKAVGRKTCTQQRVQCRFIESKKCVPHAIFELVRPPAMNIGIRYPNNLNTMIANQNRKVVALGALQLTIYDAVV